tara:strand:- start:103 stop:378 length:276 start_codon:yes stop_codon:yes gene_type:complete
MSIVDCTSDKPGLAVIVVDAELVPPVIVSPAVNEPEGTVRVRLVEVGFVIILAVVPLVPPVRVSPTVRLPEAATVAVIVPTGYSTTPEARV